MNRILITIAIASTLSAALSVQAEDKAVKDGTPVVYGKVLLSYGAREQIDSGTTIKDNWELRSHASRIGFKGERALSEDLSVTYKFEWEVNYEQDVDSGFSRRNMYGGFKGSWGELRFGRHDTPMKMTEGPFDQFKDTDAELKNAGDEDGRNRLDNILMYMGKTNGYVYQLLISPGEDNAGATANDGPADTISAAFGYSDGPVHVMFAHDRYANGANQSEDSLTRIVGVYKFSNMQIGVLIQSGVEAADTAAAKEDWLGVSFNVKVGSKGKIKAQYIHVEDSRSQKLEGSAYAVGYDHSLGKKTTGYVMYSKLDEDDTSGSTDDYETSFLGIGFIMSF